MQKSRFVLAAALILSQSETYGFSTVSSPAATRTAAGSASKLQLSDENDDAAINSNNGNLHAIRSIKSSIKPIGLALLTSVSSAFLPQQAMASAPVTPIKNFKPPDSKAIALKKINDAKNQEKMQEQMAHQIKCEEIEEEQGSAARVAFEKEYEDNLVREAEERALNRRKLMYGLTDMGICPFVDNEGERQVYLFDHGIDLNKVPATKQQKEMMNLKRDKKLPIRRQKERFLVKCIVEDVKSQGEDPLKYLEENKAKTQEIVNMKDRQLDAVVGRYSQLLQQQGSISGTKSDTPFDVEAAIIGVVDEKAAKAAEKAKAAAEKAAAKAQKDALKAEKAKAAADEKAAKDAAKAEAKAAKEAAKAEAKAAKEAAKAEAAAAKAAVESEDVSEASEEDAVESEEDLVEDDAVDVETEEDETETETTAEVVVAREAPSFDVKDVISKAPVVPIVAVVGAGIAFKTVQGNKQAEEEERQRQFKLIMGMDEDVAVDEDDDGGDDEAFVDPSESSAPTEKKSEPQVTPAPKKKRSRFSVFSKKNAREVDLSNLVAESATAPEFSALLAKMLTFGAQGRFPDVTALEGGMPMKEFDLDSAKSMLSEATASSGLTKEAAAEAFACVVNCMIIDIIDLASSSLGAKEKKETLTVDALNVVMDFMDHAASLFDAVADGVAITPVTYGGVLSKSKLEDMFAIYSSSSMTSMDGSVTQDRVDTLQQVFKINDKRAEGLAQKAMMKNLMNMMKDGEGGMEGLMEGLGGMEGMEGMEEMMKGLGGDFGADDGDISPEQLKQSVTMMKELIDSGSVSKEELGLVREQFKQMYGSDIDELIKAADSEGGTDELGEDGAELLELFKTILKDD